MFLFGLNSRDFNNRKSNVEQLLQEGVLNVRIKAPIAREQ